MARNLVILHFNDVYNVESRASPEPVGGAARFCTAIKSLQHLNPLILFSGDAFSPSVLSTFTQGQEMVPVLNSIGVHCAVYGNRDFDFGLEVLEELKSQTNFPWLISNVMDNSTNRPLGSGLIKYVLNEGNLQIGLIGLVELEWVNKLTKINPQDVTYYDFIEVAKKLSAQLKDEGCDLIIALTHMRLPNDIKVAEQCDNIDLILGGHDHEYMCEYVNGKFVVKSGTEFRQFSKISIEFENNAISHITIKKVYVTKNFTEDVNLQEQLENFLKYKRINWVI